MSIGKPVDGSQRLPVVLGQCLQGTVSYQMSANQYTLNTDHQEFVIESTSQLAVGQKMTIQVIAVTPQLQFQIVPTVSLQQRIGTSLYLLTQQSKLFSQLSVFSETAEFKQLGESSTLTFQSIWKNFESIISNNYPNNSSVLGLQLRQIVKDLGLEMEAFFSNGKIKEATNTLKFSLLELSQTSTHGDSQFSSVNDLLQSIQLYQLLQLKLSTDFITFIPLPFPFLRQGFVLIDSWKEESDADSEHKPGSASPLVSLHLQLEGLGNVQVDIRKTTDHLSVIFYTENAERAKFMSKFREELEQMVTTAPQCSVQFLVGAKEPIKVLLERMIHGSTGMVNISA